ncbi:MAG: hypothetical protein IKO55_01310 [Kiritimatiellae bacterium]|nr:hypothetical protein [Kiritimatiellia bacterium]
MVIKKKEEINFNLMIGLGEPPIRINGFDISRDKMPSEEFYSGNRGMCAGRFGQRDDFLPIIAWMMMLYGANEMLLA